MTDLQKRLGIYGLTTYPSGTNASPIINAGVAGAPVSFDFTQINGLAEATVINIAVKNATRIKLSASGELGMLLEQPSRLRTINSWKQQVVRYGLKHNRFIIGLYNGLRLFVYYSTDESQRVYTLTDDEGTWSISERFIGGIEYNGTPAGIELQTKLRALDGCMFSLMEQAQGLKGVLKMGGYNDLVALTDDDAVANIRKMQSYMKTASVSPLPQGVEFEKVDKFTDYNNYWNTILRMWAKYLGVPSALLDIDLPTQSTSNRESAKQGLVDNVYRPLFEQVADYLRVQFPGTDLVIDYDDVIQPSGRDKAETLMKLAQSGIFTTNELREKFGYEPIEGGDMIPDTAGAPPTEDKMEDMSDEDNDDEEE